MNISKVSLRAIVAVATALLAMSLMGCMPTNSAESDAQAANRQYMASVNQCMDSISEKLASFEDAVARGDVVTMKTQADKAFKEIDDLEAVEAPEVLADVKAGYVEGCRLLEDALSSYVDLFTQVDSGAVAADSAEYASAIAGIQATYDEGISKLEATDKLALGL